MDDAEFQKLLNASDTPAPVPAPVNTLADGTPLDPPSAATKAQTQGKSRAPSEAELQAMDHGLGDATGLDALVGGGLKSIFETGDFLFGETKREDRTEFRSNVEGTVDARREQSMVDGFSAGIGQFAVGMLGLGKATTGIKAGAALLSTAKAAIVGAVAFDPHEERLSNLIQKTPLANPVNAWLAADPDDSAAEGRVKAIIESIGLDATIAAVFMGATKGFKMMKAGRAEEAVKVLDDLQADMDAKASVEVPESAVVPEAGAASEVAPAAPSAAPEVAPSAAPEVAPSAAPEVAPSAAPEVAPSAAPEVAPSAAPEATPSVAPEAPVIPAPAPDTIAVARVNTVTEAAAADGVVGRPPSSRPPIKMTFTNVDEVLAGASADSEAMAKHGGYYQAIEAGHVFGKGARIPYATLTTQLEVDNFVARAADAMEEQLDKFKGGAVITDEQAKAQLMASVKLFNADPALVVGKLFQAGEAAKKLRASFEASRLLTEQMFQDAYHHAMRIKLGDFTEFGTQAASRVVLQQRLSMAISLLGTTESIIGNSARTVRSGRFGNTKEALAKLMKVDGDVLLDLLEASGGDTRNLIKLANPTLYAKTVHYAQHLLINNLVSGPTTQVINLLGSGAMLGSRPLQRILGNAAMGNSRGVRQALKQFGYYGSALVDGRKAAVRAFLKNDSIIAPHKVEGFGRQESSVASRAVKTIRAGEDNFKPFDSLSNVLHNALLVGTTVVGIPTRTLGTVDELVKQIVYRSHVSAGAHMDAVEEAVKQGIPKADTKAFIADFIKTRVDESFDAAGRAINPESLQEALVSTFQQDLLPKTLGKGIQNLTTNVPELKLVLPFVKTPSNLLREGWRLSPGLNLAQKEYWAALNGEFGPASKAQAIGQMAMGSLFMGSAAALSASGQITGGGPRDPKAKAELQATGWRPYSLVVDRDDGSKTYIPFGRVDPVAIPIGIVADLHDAINNLGEGGEEDHSISAAIGALAVALSKQFANKQYLFGVNQFLDALMSQSTTADTAAAYAGKTAGNFMPFASAMRQLNQDEHVREARSFTDNILKGIPGLSDELPAKYNWLGEPIRVRNGLWATDDASFVDNEVTRLLLVGDGSVSPVSPRVEKVDLRDLTLATGENAYERYQQLTSQLPGGGPTQRVAIAKLMRTKAYQQAPDGPSTLRGTKLWMLHPIQEAYRGAALKIIKADPVVREALTAPKLRIKQAYDTLKARSSGGPMVAPKTQTLGTLGAAFGQDLEAPAPTTQEPQ